MVNPLEFFKSSRRKKKHVAPEIEAPQGEAPQVVAVAEEVAPPAVTASAPTEPLSPPTVAELAGAASAVRRTYGEALQAVGRFFKVAADGEGPEAEDLPIADVETAAGKLVEEMADAAAGDELVALAVGRYPDNERFIVPHSVNVAILSQRVGRQLNLEGSELQTICVAALIHDVGTVKIPKEVFYKADSLSDDEWKIMRQRPAMSAEIISSIGEGYRAVGEIAHQVHERLDGAGYPRGLNVDGIALEASILGAVDIFEAFIHARPYKKTVPAAAMYGVDNLMKMSHQFGDGVLKALVRSVGLFPVGTYVRLNSGEIAKVVRARPANPMRPEVEVVFDMQKRQLKETRPIDLMASPHLYVFKPLSPEDLVEFGL